MQLSVIILNYKAPYFLHLCLQSVQRAITGLDAEILVIDNNSQDESVNRIKTHFPEVLILENTENLGFSKANNLGVKQASGEFICILNPDMVLPENCFKTLLQFSEDKKDLGAVGVRLIDGSGDYLRESKRNVPNIEVAFQKLMGDTSKYYANQLAQDEIGEVPVLVGAFMFLKKSTYEAVAGFDEDYFMYGEDIDLSYKLLQNGYKNYYFGSLTALHFKGESTVKNRKYHRRFYRAMQTFQKKHFSKGTFVDVLIASALKLIAETKSTQTSVLQTSDSDRKIFWVSQQSTIPKGLKCKNYNTLQVIAVNEISCLQNTNGTVIFDLQELKVREVLQAVALLKNSKNRFRIRPSNCNFSVGSDTSTSQGELLKW